MGKKIQCIGRYVMDGQVLGKGNFARVELATHGVTGCKVAIKIIDTRKIKEDYTRQNLHREARILGQIRHPNIIRLYETLKATTLHCLVLEYASGGDLLAFIKQQKDARLSEEKARLYFRQLTSAIHYLHERGVAHRDLKMENILLDEKKKNVKVIDALNLLEVNSAREITICLALHILVEQSYDFGLSNTFNRDDLMKTHCGSLEYAAPELIASTDKYGPEVDNWSLGVILYAMVVGKLPFTTHYTDQYRRQKLQQQIEKGIADQQEKEMVFLTDDCQDLLRKLLEPLPEQRLPLMDLEIHSWVTLDNKMPFCPFQHLPKEKRLKPQVIEELSGLLSMDKDKVAKNVHEHKCDDLSAMFNMMLDTRRYDKGYFDTDFTIKQEKKLEVKGHTKVRRHRSARKGKDSKASIDKFDSPLARNTIKEEVFWGSENNLISPPDIYQIPLCMWEEFVKATPSLLCPDMTVDPGSDTETQPEPLFKSINSTSFDLMAICSAPTWLGPDRRKSRRRARSPMPVHHVHHLQNLQESEKTEEGEAAHPSGPSHSPGNPNLLVPANQASTAVSALLRRNSSRRQSRRRTSSLGPPSRRGSSRRRRTDTGSQPSSPNSPSLTPQIKIDTPKQSPVQRPANLLGLKECYATPTVYRYDTPPKGPLAHSRRIMRKSETSDSHLSDSSNPCSTTNLHEVCSNASDSHETLPRTDSHNSVGQAANQELSVESKIAAADIRSIVRPKQLNTRRKNISPHTRENNPRSAACKLEIPTSERRLGMPSASPEIVIESMQSSNYANLSDDEKIEHRSYTCDIPRTDSEKRIEQRIMEIQLPEDSGVSENVDGASNDMGASNVSSQTRTKAWTDVVHNNEDLLIQPSHSHALYASSLASTTNSTHNASVDQNATSSTEMVELEYRDPFFSKRGKLVENLYRETTAAIVDSSDQNSSQENLLERTGRSNSRDILTSEESIALPDLCSARDVRTPEGMSDDAVTPIRSSRGSFVKHGSTPSVRFVMPSTPIRQMFKMPIARIESFHSDDFEVFTSEVDAIVTSPSPSPSPNSVQTPTVPCFQYKIHRHRKKHLQKDPRSRGNNYVIGNMNARDGVMTVIPDKSLRIESKVNEPVVFSSGSEYGSDSHLQDGGERLASTSKAKIHPMDRDDQDAGELSIKGHRIPHPSEKSKLLPDGTTNNQSSSKKMQNSVNKSSKVCGDSENKRSGVKMAWKKGFAHLLKKKKFGHVTSSGNNNNDIDSPSRNLRSSNTRNGHARALPSSPTAPKDCPPPQDRQTDVQCQQGTVVQNNVSGNLEVQSSPVPLSSPSPTRTKVYDFTVVTNDSSSKSKTCLLSWKGCRECTFSDDNSPEESSDYRLEQNVDMAINTSLPINNFQDAKTYTTYKFAHS